MKKSKIIFSVIVFCFMLTKLRAQEELLVLKTETGDLEGTLSLPAAPSRFPLVVLIAGSGPTDRNGNQDGMENNSLKYIAQVLLKNNIASFRFDKRGVGRSTEAMSAEINLRFDHYVDDVKKWLDLLAQDKRFSKIIIAGHSEGALIGMIAAIKNKNVSAYISIAGAGRPADEILKEQLSVAPQSVQEVVFPMIDSLKAGVTFSDVPRIFYPLFRPSVQPYMISWIKYNPQVEIKKIDVPILIVQGTTDIQVKEADAELLSKAQLNAQLEIIKNMNHVLKDCDTINKEKQTPIYSNPDLPLNEMFVLKLVGFIKGLQ